MQQQRGLDPRRTSSKVQSRPSSPVPVRSKSPARVAQSAVAEKKITIIEPVPVQKKTDFVAVDIPERPKTPEPKQQLPKPVPRRGSIGGLQSLTKNLMDHDTQISDLKGLISRQESVIKSYEASSKKLEGIVTQQEKIIRDLQQSLDEVING
jgi:hypothetical protein